MAPVRLLIGFIMFWVLANIGCNMVQGLAMVTGINTALSPNGGISSSTTTYSTDRSGAPAQYMAPGNSFLTTIQQWVFFDYPSIFKNADGTDDEFRSAVRYAILISMGIGVLISIILIVKQLFSV